MCCIEEKTCDIFWTFRRPPVIRRPGHCSPSWRPWCDTSQQSAQLWNSQSPECRTTSPNSEIRTTLVRPCIQNAHERLVRQVLLAKSTGKQPRGRPKPRWSNCIPDLAWSRLGVEPAVLSEIAVDWGIPSPPRARLPRDPPWTKCEHENEWNE